MTPIQHARKLSHFPRRQFTQRELSASVNDEETTKDTPNEDAKQDQSNILTLALTQDSHPEGNTTATFTDIIVNHEMLRMLGIDLKIQGFTPSDESSSSDNDPEEKNTNNDTVSMQEMKELDAVCFENAEAVKDWLKLHDTALGISTDEHGSDVKETETEEGDDSESEKESNNSSTEVKEVVEPIAICKSTEVANACLQSERWERHRIYYPSGYVMKEGSEDDPSAAMEAIEKWADSAMQGLGDVMERRFWGGGW